MQRWKIQAAKHSSQRRRSQPCLWHSALPPCRPPRACNGRQSCEPRPDPARAAQLKKTKRSPDMKRWIEWNAGYRCADENESEAARDVPNGLVSHPRLTRDVGVLAMQMTSNVASFVSVFRLDLDVMLQKSPHTTRYQGGAMSPHRNRDYSINQSLAMNASKRRA